jgi:prefoldin subunit 5
MDATLESRVAALEAALGLPNNSSSSSVGNEILQEKIETLEAAVAKANFRILHLTRGFDAKSKEVEELKSKLAAKSS